MRRDQVRAQDGDQVKQQELIYLTSKEKPYLNEVQLFKRKAGL
jgi:hypothetical protein